MRECDKNKQEEEGGFQRQPVITVLRHTRTPIYLPRDVLALRPFEHPLSSMCVCVCVCASSRVVVLSRACRDDICCWLMDDLTWPA